MHVIGTFTLLLCVGQVSCAHLSSFSAVVGSHIHWRISLTLEHTSIPSGLFNVVRLSQSDVNVVVRHTAKMSCNFDPAEGDLGSAKRRETCILKVVAALIENSVCQPRC